MKQFLVTILLMVVITMVVDGQYFSSGQDPAGTRWNMIKTEHVKVIFPVEYVNRAQYLANILDTVYAHEHQNFKIKPRCIPVVIHPYSVTSNAFVGWAPRRMEFFTIPPGDGYAQPWFQQLGLHEYRHVVQISQMVQGVTRLLSYFTGQQGPVGVFGTYVPFWFIEGDAVFAETYFSETGRGRMPSFTMPLRAQIETKGIYSYDKAVLGSYKDFVPDRYILGYHLVANGYNEYGLDFWPGVLNHVARNPYMIVPFSEGIRKSTTMNKVRFYENSLLSLKKAWNSQPHQHKTKNEYKVISKNPSDYTWYRFPGIYKDQIVSFKKSLGSIPEIVGIGNEGEEKVLHRPGLISGDNLSVGGNYVCWAEKNYDPRWENREYSNIFLFDLQTGKTTKLTKKARYFMPAISHDGKHIAAVEISPENQYSLIILNTENGAMTGKFSTAENYFIGLPSWSEDGTKITFLVTGDLGKQIASLNTKNGCISYHTPFSKVNITQPVFYKNMIVYVGSNSGINDLYALDTMNQKTYRLTESAFGIFDPVVKKGSSGLMASEYTENGYRIVEVSINDMEKTEAGSKTFRNINPFRIIDTNNRFILSNKVIPEKTRPVKKYSKILNLFDFHSWSPVYFDFNNDELDPGIIFLSQNTLGTSFTSLGWKYDLNEQTGKYILNYSYQGWYPVLDVGLEHGKRKGIFRDSANQVNRFSYYQTKVETGFRLPLKFTHNQYYRGIQPWFRLSRIYLTKDKTADITIISNEYTSGEYGIYIYNLRKRSQRDIIPKWGQSLGVHLGNILFEDDRSGISAVEMILYFPGFINNHGIKAYLGYQELNFDHYNFSSEISNPRGYPGLYYNDMLSFKADYIFPVLYPDFSVSSLMYIKRIRAAVFYDYARGKTGNISNNFSSTGIDLRLDVHIFRFISPFDLGLRSIYLPETNEIKFEFLFAINVDALY